jgi:hypothetical protein
MNAEFFNWMQQKEMKNLGRVGCNQTRENEALKNSGVIWA